MTTDDSVIYFYCNNNNNNVAWRIIHNIIDQFDIVFIFYNTLYNNLIINFVVIEYDDNFIIPRTMSFTSLSISLHD